MADKTGVPHVDAISGDWEQYCKLVEERKPERVFARHETIYPDGGWYGELYRWGTKKDN